MLHDARERHGLTGALHMAFELSRVEGFRVFGLGFRVRA